MNIAINYLDKYPKVADLIAVLELENIPSELKKMRYGDIVTWTFTDGSQICRFIPTTADEHSGSPDV